MKNKDTKYKVAVVIVFFASLFSIILSTDRDEVFAIPRTIYACFFSWLLFYLLFIYKKK